MNTATTCPGCGATVEVPDDLIGQRVRCPVPGCGVTFTAQVSPTTAPPPAPAAPIRPPPAPRPPTLSEQYGIPPLPRRPTHWHLGWVVASLVSLVVIGASVVATLLLLLNGRGTAEP